MKDAHLAALAAEQHNRVSKAQLFELGFTDDSIMHRVERGRLVTVEQAVYALAPVLDDDRGLWMGATLTAPDTVLSRISAAAAWGAWSLERPYETVTRPGSGGRRRFGGILVYRSTTLDGDCTEHEGIPITTIERALLDIACDVSERALARTLRESVRLKRTDVRAVASALGRYRGRRGVGRLGAALARYSGLPIERARSGAEVRALEILRADGRPMPRLNVMVSGEEADLVWREERLIVEIDGGPFHLDVGEDQRKQARWETAGWIVRRLPSDNVYERPASLLSIAPPPR